MTLPYRLKELRQQKNLTQAKVADYSTELCSLGKWKSYPNTRKIIKNC